MSKEKREYSLKKEEELRIQCDENNFIFITVNNKF